MPADFLSRATIDEINAIDPFKKDLPTLQRECSQSKMNIVEQIYKVMINLVFTSKNKKFFSKWIGPMPITISEKVVEVQFQNTKKKYIVNVDIIKPFVQKIHQSDFEEEIYYNISEDSIKTDPKEILPPKPVLSEKTTMMNFIFQTIKHADKRKKTEQNFLTSISKRKQNLILSGHLYKHWDFKDAHTYKIHLGLLNQGPLLNRTRTITDHGYISQTTEPLDPSERSSRSPDEDTFLKTIQI